MVALFTGLTGLKAAENPDLTFNGDADGVRHRHHVARHVHVVVVLGRRLRVFEPLRYMPLTKFFRMNTVVIGWPSMSMTCSPSALYPCAA